MDDPNELVEVYATATGRKQRVPRIWINDPILGAGIRLTPSQREHDGALPPRPTEDSTVPEIDGYAETVGIDLPSKASKTDKLLAVEDVFAPAEEQAGLEPVAPAPRFVDPLAPEVVAHVDAQPPAPVTPDVEPDVEDPEEPAEPPAVGGGSA